MARIRTVKPEFFQHDGLSTLSIAHRYLFIGLWTQADREGRMSDRPGRLRIAIMPYEPLTDEQFDAMLWDLAEHRERFIVRYEADGERFIAVRSFAMHQRPHPRDPESRIPDFSRGSIVSRVNTRESTDDRGNPGRSPDAPLSKSPRVQESNSLQESGGAGERGEKPDPAPPEKRKGNRDGWLTDYALVWQERFGLFHFAKHAPFLRPVDKELGREEGLRRWRLFCAETDAKYASASRFAETHRRYDHAAIRPGKSTARASQPTTSRPPTEPPPGDAGGSPNPTPDRYAGLERRGRTAAGGA